MTMEKYEQKAEKALKEFGLSISITQKGLSNKWGSNRFQYSVKFSRQGRAISMQFFDSEDNYYNNERPTKYDVLSVFISEASSGMNFSSVEDVMREFGYEYKEAARVYRGLSKQAEKAEKLGLSFEDLQKMDEIIDG